MDQIPLLASVALAAAALFQEGKTRLILGATAVSVGLASIAKLFADEREAENDAGVSDKAASATEKDANAIHDDVGEVSGTGEVIKPPPATEPTTTKKKRLAVVFDFDKCLMQGHWWAMYKNGPLERINPQPQDFAHDDIGDLFTRILSVDGILLAVASFGRTDVIRKAVESAIGETEASKVFITTPGNFDGYRDGCSMGAHFKNLELELICDTYELEPQDLIFFDDSKDNINHAKQMGCAAHVTAPFSRRHEQLIFDHIGQPDLCRSESESG